MWKTLNEEEEFLSGVKPLGILKHVVLGIEFGASSLLRKHFTT
jgi:hypothetical protein